MFDKSFLQSLSVDESVWFDHFFVANVCPLFYVETLADLEKTTREGRTPEHEVEIIAQKFPEMHGSPNAYHVDLCVANLMGRDIPMTGQIVLAGGRKVQVAGKSGVVFEQSPEAEAFIRWEKGEFLDIERVYARAWRETVSNLNLEEVAERLRAMGIDGKSCKSLEDARNLAQEFVGVHYSPVQIMRLMHTFLNIPWQFNDQIFARWRKAAFPPLTKHSPYAAYVLTIELFFQIALASDLVSAGRPSNRVDIAYLFYLPFCMAFVSSDRLHRRCAPLFLRHDQEFIWGFDLKQDLARLDSYYAQQPASAKEKGIMSLAGVPPKDGDFLVAMIWDRLFPNWRQSSETRPDKQPLNRTKVLEYVEQFVNAPTVTSNDIHLDQREVDMLAVKRRVRRKKGSWLQVPKDF